MVEAVGIEPTSTAVKIGVIHRHSWFVIVSPTKLGSCNPSAYCPVAVDFLIFTTDLLCCLDWTDGSRQPPDYAAMACSK